MISIPTTISSADLDQWLNNGWFLHKVGKTSIPIRYGGYSPYKIYGTDIEGCPAEALLCNSFAHWPVCGAINLNRIALNVIRRQVRQYRRTYNSRQVRLCIPQKWGAVKLYGQEVTSYHANHVEVVKALFNPQYTSYAKAVASIKSNKTFSRAISRHIILVGTNKENIVVYYKGAMVATLVDDLLLPIEGVNSDIRKVLKYLKGSVYL